MDRLIYTSLNSLENLREQKVAHAQNLANQQVPGFRADFENGGSARFIDVLGTLDGRAMQLGRGEMGFSQEPGFMDQTNEPLDVAIPDAGYFYSQAEGADPALTRRGDLRLDAEGRLMNGAGEAMLDEGLRPIVLPPFRAIQVDDAGQILIEPLDGEPGVFEPVSRLATVIPDPAAEMRKGLDGQIRLADGTVPPPDQAALVRQGVLERSNVNTTDELIAQIDMQREWEINIRMISTARELDEAGGRLLRLPES